MGATTEQGEDSRKTALASLLGSVPLDAPGVGALFALARAFVPVFGIGVPKLLTTPPAIRGEGALEARVRKAESRYQTLVERIPVVTFMVSFENQASEVYVSPQVETMLGYTAKEWVENPILWYERLHPGDRARWNDEFSRTVAYAESFKSDHRFLAKDGHVVWIHGEVTVERDETGTPSFMQGIGYDITEMKRAEEVQTRSRDELDALVKVRTAEILEVNRSLESEIGQRKKAEERQAQLLGELKEINEQLNQFAYVVSHDLKAPLRGISSLAEWITADYGDRLDEAGREQFRLLLGRAKRANALIDGILRYSRISRQHEEHVNVDVNQVVLDVCELLAPPSTIVLHIGPDLPTVMGEKTRLIQVFENLISNAVKHMGRPEGEIFVGCKELEDFWQFHVRDTGPGIAEKYFEKIFQIFQTLAARDDRESTGIGLAVVKKNVELFGGRIWVESTVGTGSTFYFTMPKSG